MTTIQHKIQNSSVDLFADPSKDQKHDMAWLMGLFILTRRLSADQYAARTNQIISFTRANENILREQEDQNHRVTSVAPAIVTALKNAKSDKDNADVTTQVQVAQLQQQAEQAQRDNAAAHVREGDQLMGILNEQNGMTAGEISQEGEIFIATNKAQFTLTQTIFR